MKVSIGADHAGFPLKTRLVTFLKEEGHTVIDHGTFSSNSVDYPDFAQAVARDVAQKNADRGVLICSTGIGMSITANKIAGIRAALVHNADTAEFARLHNDANVLCMGAKSTSEEEARQWAHLFMNTAFSNEERHHKRVQKIES